MFLLVFVSHLFIVLLFSGPMEGSYIQAKFAVVIEELLRDATHDNNADSDVGSGSSSSNTSGGILSSSSDQIEGASTNQNQSTTDSTEASTDYLNTSADTANNTNHNDVLHICDGISPSHGVTFYKNIKPVQTAPIIDLLQSRHDLLYTRLFNS